MSEPNETAPWPNQQPVPEGVEPVSQDPGLFADEEVE